MNPPTIEYKKLDAFSIPKIYYTIDDFCEAIKDVKGAKIDHLQVDAHTDLVRLAKGTLTINGKTKNANWNSRGECRTHNRLSKYDLYF